jgi:hypothetical protein
VTARAWSFELYSMTPTEDGRAPPRDVYEVTDYGPRQGMQVTRRGFTVWTGFARGTQLVTDSTQLPVALLTSLLDKIRETDPKRAGQTSLFGAPMEYRAAPVRKPPPAPLPVQHSLFGVETMMPLFTRPR